MRTVVIVKQDVHQLTDVSALYHGDGNDDSHAHKYGSDEILHNSRHDR